MEVAPSNKGSILTHHVWVDAVDDGVDYGVGVLVDQLDTGVLEAFRESVACRLEQVLDHAPVGGVVEGVEHLRHNKLTQSTGGGDAIDL